MIGKTILAAAVLALTLGAAGEASAAWRKSYVVEWLEPAMYYGGPKDGGPVEAGTDCPNGPNAEPDWIQVLVKAGYTLQEATWLRDPSHPFRVPNHGQNQMAFRGKDRANIYVNPEATPDPGLTQVTGRIGEGLDLDGDRTNGFTSVTGERGIDNQFYRTLGCWKVYRGRPRDSESGQFINADMRAGGWAVVVVVSGEGADPMNDPKVKVGFYSTNDPLVKDANGNIIRDATFRIQPDVRLEAILNARTVNGEITSSEAAREIWIRDPGYAREMQLLNARLRLRMQSDGTLSGVLAGYRPWWPVYQGWVNARGSVVEQLYHVELPGVYYALKRNADYSPTGPGGPRTHMSYAMRIEAIPAYVVAPDAAQQVAEVASYKSVAPPRYGVIPSVSFQSVVVDGIVRDRTGVPPGGPHVVIPPPTNLLASAPAGGTQ